MASSWGGLPCLHCMHGQLCVCVHVCVCVHACMLYIHAWLALSSLGPVCVSHVNGFMHDWCVFELLCATCSCEESVTGIPIFFLWSVAFFQNSPQLMAWLKYVESNEKCLNSETERSKWYLQISKFLRSAVQNHIYNVTFYEVADYQCLYLINYVSHWSFTTQVFSVD